MANVGSGPSGTTYIGAGNGASGTFKPIGTNSGLTAHGVVIAEGNGAFAATAVGTSGFVLTSNGGASDPSFQAVSSTGAVTSLAVQTGTSPVVPSSGIITVNGATVVAGTNPVRTDGTGPNTVAIEVQRSQAIASTDATKIGLAAFNSADFSVDSNGFVSISSGGFSWLDKAASFNAAAQTGYFVTANATATLPASPSQGDTIKFFVDGAVTLTIQANTGQTIQFATNVSASAGTQVNTMSGDSCELVYRAADTKWCCINFVGAWNKT
jgi:hypothetical protein